MHRYGVSALRRSRAGAELVVWWAQAALPVAVVTAAMYLTGWGAALAVLQLPMIALVVHRCGGRAWPPAAVAGASMLALGEAGVAAGVLPDGLPQPHGHVLAGLVALAMVSTAWVLGAAATGRERAEHTARMSGRRYEALLRDGADLVLLTDGRGEVGYAAPSAARVLGVEPSVLLGAGLRERIHPQDRTLASQLRARLRTEPAAAGEHTTELRVRHHSGDWRWYELAGRNLLADPAVGALLIRMRDVTAQRAMRARVAEAAGRDPVTGLAMSATLERDVDRALRHGTRYQHPVGVLVVNLDGLASLADSGGTEAVNALLGEVAEVLRRSIRDTDVAARLDDTRFGVLLGRVEGAEKARRVAARILRGITARAAAGARFEVASSIGLALSHPGGTDAQTLMQHADTAMHRARRRGRNRCEVYIEQETIAPWN
ncbi:diguanylate cyclase domain-containing protein [Krasilnikovia sp. MM14-A1259]|uniref:diguanylate cyclase domain-containing protein n=1 Tax=Krasilnikovia sp. MM14-A1259 TaxID=3373539 RepID=UPI003827E0BE